MRLDKEININLLLQKIQKEIQQHSQSNNLADSILYIDIKTISQNSNELILKIENTLENSNDRGNEVSK